MDGREDFDRLLRHAEEWDREREQARGARLEILKRLKEEFGVDSLEGAERLYERLTAKKEKVEKALAPEYRKFVRAYKDKLGGAT